MLCCDLACCVVAPVLCPLCCPQLSLVSPTLQKTKNKKGADEYEEEECSGSSTEDEEYDALGEGG